MSITFSVLEAATHSGAPVSAHEETKLLPMAVKVKYVCRPVRRRLTVFNTGKNKTTSPSDPQQNTDFSWYTTRCFAFLSAARGEFPQNANLIQPQTAPDVLLTDVSVCVHTCVCVRQGWCTVSPDNILTLPVGAVFLLFWHLFCGAEQLELPAGELHSSKLTCQISYWQNVRFHNDGESSINYRTGHAANDSSKCCKRRNWAIKQWKQIFIKTCKKK